ncbi:MAG TPA: ATP-binding protein [Candidatus Omnitrophota bacterium]|nr:ATP-binding protein [Candidatus Omnitrophota bacterium]
MRIKLHWKLTLFFCSAALLGLVAGYFLLTTPLQDYLEKSLKKNLHAQLSLGRKFLVSQIDLLRDATPFDAISDDLGRQLNVRVTIIDNSGTVLGDSDLDQEKLRTAENHSDRQEIQQAAKTGFGFIKRYSYTIKDYLLYVAIPFSYNEKNAFLRFAIPLTDVRALQEKFQLTIALTLLLVFILSLALTFLISSIVSRPLSQMANIAKAMAQGDFSIKPSIYSTDEIGDLASALTHMSDEINNKIERIRHESAKLDAVLSSMFEGIMVVNSRGEIILMNPSLKKLFFVDTEPLGRKPIEAIRNALVQQVTDQILGLSQNFISQEVQITHPNDKILRVNGTPIIRDNRLEGAVLVFHDITELRRLERIRQEFVANVSHELRTPISSIKGYAETLLSGAIEDKENAKDFINIIYQDSNRLASLISDLLDLAKIESEKLQMEFLPVEIKPLVLRCISILKKTIDEKQLTVSCEISEKLPKAMADDARLSQVLLNLLDNAVKYTPQKGTIRIGAQVAEKYIQIDISDTGIGIPQEDIPRIFERFYRVDKARSRELGGTGLGLSIAKHIVLSHGGQIWAHSKPGEGTTFSFTIPEA